MEITKETFMEVLGLVEWDDKVLDLLEHLEIERPSISGEEHGCERISEQYGISLYFSTMTASGTKYIRENDGSLYFKQVAWESDTTLSLPFGIKMGDDYNTVISKVGREPDTPEALRDGHCGWGNYEKPYWINCGFTDKSMQELKKVYIRLQQPYDFTKEW